MSAICGLIVFFVYSIHRYDGKCYTGIEMVDDISDENPTGSAFRISLTEAADKYGAVCLDGTTPDLYLRPGTDDGQTKWNINIAAGGWCTGINTTIIQPPSKIDTCYHRTTTTSGTSKFNKPSARIFGEWNDINATINPVCHNWNSVVILYCDGGSFTADNETVYNDTKNNITLYFRGHRILIAAFEKLWNDYNMKDATDIIISGCSAGALSTFLHINELYDRYVVNGNPSINFRAVADSGFFLEYQGLGEFIMSMQWLHQWGNVTGNSANQKCFEYYNNSKNLYLCMFAQNNAALINPNIKFLSYQSQYDRWQIENELVNYTNNIAVDNYGANLTYYYINNFINTNINNTGYLDSCFHHCGEWQYIYIDGMMQSDVFVDWFYDNSTHDRLYFQNMSYPCDICCQPPSNVYNGHIGYILCIIIVVVVAVCLVIGCMYLYCKYKSCELNQQHVPGNDTSVNEYQHVPLVQLSRDSKAIDTDHHANTK
eukprot:337640_1